MRGASIAAVVTVAVAAPAWGAEYFLSPTGNDLGVGTRTAPLLTFAGAVSKLLPGDTLTVLGGHYTPTANGVAAFDCTLNARSGLPFAPITVRADVERTAWLDTSAGGGEGVFMLGCSFWRIEGLHVSSGDVDFTPTPLVIVQESDHVELKRLVLDHPDRFQLSAVILVQGSTNVLVEECELYDFHAAGLALQDSDSCGVRRCYFNSRNAADIDGGAVTRYPLAGDSAVAFRGRSRGNIVENCISEGQDGYLILPDPGQDNRINRVLGSVAAPLINGISATAADGTADGMPVGTTVQDFVTAGGFGPSVDFRSAKWSRCSRCTALQTLEGFVAEVDTHPGDGFYTTLFDQSLAASYNGGLDGVSLVSQSRAWAVDVVANGFSNDFAGPVSSYIRASATNPSLGACVLWLPDFSPLSGTGIGAEVLYRYEGGELTGTRLWSDAGEFPCGAQVPGVGDVPDASCVDMGVRFHVNQAGCAFPSTPSPRDAGLTPGNTFFISPTGSDMQAGTLTAPWGTLPYAIAQLHAGDTLELLNGTYAPGTTGLITVDCQMAEVGRPDAPITVRAQTPRGALLLGDGISTPLYVNRCSDWRFFDLVTIGDDAPGGSYDVVSVRDSARITLSGLLVARDNRYMNGDLVTLTADTIDSTFEDSELYDFHRHAVALFAAHGNTLRRLYMNGRNRLDIDGGYPSAWPGGDEGVLLYDRASANRIEDCVIEGSGQGISGVSLRGITANRFARNVVIGGQSALSYDDLAPGSATICAGNVATDLLSVGTATGIGSAGGRGNVCDHCTFIGATVPLNVNVASIIVDSLFDSANASIGADQSGLSRSLLGFVDVHGYGPLPDGGVNVFDEDLRDVCILAPVPGRGSDGGNLGADLRSLFTPMFPCGPIVPGFNDDDGATCSNVHLRLGVQACSQPNDAGLDAGADAGTDAGEAGLDAGVDAGPPPPFTPHGYQAGCGCEASPGAMVPLLMLIMRWRRRNRPSIVRRT